MHNNRGNSPLHLRRQIETLVVLFLVGLVGIKRERLEEEMESRWTNSNAASSPESQITFDSRIWENTRHNRPLSTHSLTKAGFCCPLILQREQVALTIEDLILSIVEEIKVRDERIVCRDQTDFKNNRQQ